MKKYKDIVYTLKKSNRKTLSIYVERDKPVSILAPSHITDNDIFKVIDKKSYWIYKQMAEIELLNISRTKKELVNGESYLYLGKPYQLKLIDIKNQKLVIKGNYFYLSKNHLKKGAALFKEFYRSNGLKVVENRISQFLSVVENKNPKIRVMDLKNRWASCSQKHLNFNWKIFMAPLKIIDYIILHELVHLKFKNHTQSFWNEIDKHMPDYMERKNWLRDNGASLELGIEC